MRRNAFVPICAAITVLGAGCRTVTYRQVEVQPHFVRGDSTQTSSPAKLHLLDGSTVMYDSGYTIFGDTVHGTGVRYSRTLAAAGTITRLPADSVAAIEAFVVTEESEKDHPDWGPLIAIAIGVAIMAALGAHN